MDRNVLMDEMTERMVVQIHWQEGPVLPTLTRRSDAVC